MWAGEAFLARWAQGGVREALFKLQHRVTRTRVKTSKLLEFEALLWPLWIRRVLVGPKSPPSARAQSLPRAKRGEGQWQHLKRDAEFLVSRFVYLQ
jgi:hypothetical protein